MPKIIYNDHYQILVDPETGKYTKDFTKGITKYFYDKWSHPTAIQEVRVLKEGALEFFEKHRKERIDIYTRHVSDQADAMTRSELYALIGKKGQGKNNQDCIFIPSMKQIEDDPNLPLVIKARVEKKKELLRKNSSICANVLASNRRSNLFQPYPQPSPLRKQDVRYTIPFLLNQ
jgi:hypothetical protein